MEKSTSITNGPTKRKNVRLRQMRAFSDDTGVCKFLYDIERTFIIKVPKSMRHDILTALDGGGMSAITAKWLAYEDMLTTNEPLIRAQRNKSNLPVVTDISLDISGDCNLRCSYCFEKDIKARIGPMSEETMKATLDFIFKESKDSDRINLHFGSGEPLMNFRMLKKIVKEVGLRARQCGKKVSYELTTNATLVDSEVQAFFRDNPFNVRVSCDGPQSIHDKFRMGRKEISTYNKTERGIKLLIDAIPDRLTVNSVVCNGTRLIDLWKWIKELGAKNYLTIKVGTNSGRPGMSFDKKELDAYKEAIAFICNDILDEIKFGHSPINYQPVTKIIRRLMLPQPITRYCGVAGTYLGVASNGDIYPCFRHLGLKQYNLGNVNKGVEHSRRLEYLQHEAADVDSRQGCRECWARYMCGGACYADSIVYGQDKLKPYEPHCDFWRIEIESAIRLYYEILQIDPSYCLKLVGFDDMQKLVNGC